MGLALTLGVVTSAAAAPSRRPTKAGASKPAQVPAVAPERKPGTPAERKPGTAPERKPGDEERRSPRSEDDRDLKRGERVEFDGRIIEGQTAAQGAIYLFERLPSELRSMVLERRSFRAEVLETLYPSAAPPAAAPGTPERPPASAADRPAR